MKIGVILPSVAVQSAQNLDLATAARHAEEIGLDSVWHGDHLAVGMPTLDAPIALCVAAGATQHRRPVPVVAVGAAGALGTGAGVPTREEIASGIGRAYGKPLEQAVPIPVTGHPAEAAERLAAYRDAGAGHLVMGISGGDWRGQCDLLAEARALLA
ncbi:MAG TPA: LLM class flavin-dependent oxidoreductase, partial [Actinoallomurus sp.]